MNERVVLIIQARMGSSRLRGKSMLDLAGAPLIGRVIERIKHVKTVNQIILATTKLPEDDVLENIAINMGINVFRGSVNDLVGRYYMAAVAYDADVVVRFPGDNATPEL